MGTSSVVVYVPRLHQYHHLAVTPKHSSASSTALLFAPSFPLHLVIALVLAVVLPTPPVRPIHTTASLPVLCKISNHITQQSITVENGRNTLNMFNDFMLSIKYPQ